MQQGVCLLNSQPESWKVNLCLGRYCLKFWKPSRHFCHKPFVDVSGRLWGRFMARPWKSQHQKVFINFWANNLSMGNSEQGPPLVCMFIHFVRKHSLMLLFRVFLFAKKPTGRVGVSFEFLLLKYTTMFNQSLEVLPASAVFLLCV